MDMISRHNDSPDKLHFVIAVYFAIGFVATRFFLDRFIFRNLAVRLLQQRLDTSKINDAALATIAKCSESMWKLLYYTSVEFCALKIMLGEPWYRDNREYFRGWPHQELKSSVRLFYMCQCGFYTYSIAALLIWETRRKDFAVMMSHHVITVVLIACSYMTSLFRIGLVVLALHDASDVFLEAAKIHKYAGKELRASICFGLFAVSWLLLRLIFFPFWVIRASSAYTMDVLDLSRPYMRLLYYVFNTLLLMLLAFHVYWWVLICSMVTKQFRNRGRVGEDIRSDSDDE